jgi:glycosyltransferase involved in cell wall biosynthesis
MHCLVVSCVFAPEPVVSARTSTEVVEKLVAAGHKVTVIAPFPNRPGGKLYPGYKRTLYRKERHPEGYEIIRCFATISQASSMPSRFLENITFGATAALAALFVKRPDVVYSNTWPIFATILLTLVAGFRRLPLVVSVQDIYPESLIAQQRIAATSWLARLLRTLDRFVAQRAATLIVISDAFAHIYQHDRKIPPARIAVVPNWLASSVVTPDVPEAAAFRRQLGIPAAACLAVYGGNIGVAAGVETLVTAFAQVAHQPDFYLVIAGSGSQLGACQVLAQTLNAPRIVFHSPWQTDETSVLLAAADILVLPTQGEQSLVSVPSKLISYMLAARPIIAQAVPQSDLAHTLQAAGCGWVVEPGSAAQLAAALQLAARTDAVARRTLGSAGRTYALQHMTTEANLPRVLSILEASAAFRSGYATFDTPDGAA